MITRAPTIRGAFLVASGVVLLLEAAGISLPADAQIAALVGLVVLAGLPHGALDPLVARGAGLWRRPAGLALFIAAYMVLSGATLGLWYLAPGVSLTAFLLASAWHFSGDWRDGLPRSHRLLVGLAIVTAPALLHQGAVEAIYGVLSGPAAAGPLVTISRGVGALAAAGTLAVALARARRDRGLAAELVLLVLGALFLPPLVFFVVYFCGLHSPRHVAEVAAGLSARSLVLTGTVFTLLAAGAGFAALFAMPGIPLGDALVRVTFVGLAALTVPHMLLVEASMPSARSGYTP